MWRMGIAGCGLLSVVLILGQCAAEPGESPEVAPGEALARQHCVSCHQFPEPELLPRTIWLNEVLPGMGAFLGHYEAQPRSQYLEAGAEHFLRSVYPAEPLLPDSTWEAIKAYYLAEAPISLSGSPNPEALRKVNQFELAYPPAAVGETPLASLVQFDHQTGLLWTGDTGGEQPRLLGWPAAAEEPAYEWPLRSAPSDLVAADSQTLFLTLMGQLNPTDRALGQLVRIDLTAPDTAAVTVLLDSLRRPVSLLRTDFDRDGQPDFIVAEYGNMSGQLVWYRATAPGTFETIVLLAQPGSIRLEEADLDADGTTEVIALTAQGNETLYAIRHTAGKEFSVTPFHRFPPVYGSADFQLVDFDGDGLLDILYANGDNYDYQPIPKPYHGVRLLLNRGDWRFEEVWSYPLDGAYGVRAADFDNDGDLDLAAIAYFMPPERQSLYSFVYLENRSNWWRGFSFRPYSFPTPPGSHYLVMDAGDRDGDGDTDLVLGNFSIYLPNSGRFSQWRSGQGEQPLFYTLFNEIE